MLHIHCYVYIIYNIIYNTGDIEMSVYLSDTGTRFKCIGCALRVVMCITMYTITYLLLYVSLFIL